MTDEKAQARDILVYLQIVNQEIHPNSKELALFAYSLAAGRDLKVYGIAAASKLTEVLKEELASCPMSEVDFYLGDIYENFIPEYFSAALVDCSQRRNPGSVLVGASPEGRAVAPMAAVPLKSGVTADCTGLELDDEGLLVQTRPAYGGDVMAAIITPAARPQIATVRHGVLAAPSARGEAFKRSQIYNKKGVLAAPCAKGDAKINVLPPVMPSISPLPRVIERWVQSEKGQREVGADIVLAIGGALRQKDDVQLFQRAAAALNAPLFCSRSLVERGWLPHDRQIGLSGRSVAPKLLITMGISGSVQFQAGISGAERICAVNLDETAPLMAMADLPLVGDIYELAKALI